MDTWVGRIPSLLARTLASHGHNYTPVTRLVTDDHTANMREMETMNKERRVDFISQVHGHDGVLLSHGPFMLLRLR